MKKVIEFYYNFMNITLHKKNNYYYFYYQNNLYALLSINRSINEIIEIYRLTANNGKYNKIILNKNNLAVTNYNNKNYVLFKLMYDNTKITYEDLLENNVVFGQKKSLIHRNAWIDLWSKKIDYIEYQRNHINDKYPVLMETLDYYIGMSENAISYLKDTIDNVSPVQKDKLVISHKRIESIYKNDYYNPLLIVVDHPSRDISEYLKYIFLNDKYNIDILKSIIYRIDFSRYGYQLLFARMIYPSYYFDIYERIINDGDDIKKMNFVIRRIEEYENYLMEIYKIINQKIKIPSIDWI